MSLRREIANMIWSCFGFSKITKSTTHDVYDIDGEMGEAVTPGCERWGDAALLSRPQDGAEGLYYHFGDERVVIATRDRRWAIEVAKGEAVLRAMGPGSPAYVRLKPDGTCEVVATAVKLTSPTATQPFVRGTALHTYLDGVINALKTAITSAGPGGPAAVATLNATLAGLAAQKLATTSTKITGD